MSRIAFVHDRIYHLWWAEQVFFDLIASLQTNDVNHHSDEKIWPLDEHVIFTLFADHSYYMIRWVRYRVVMALPWRISQIFLFFHTHRVWVLSRLFDYRNLMFWYRPLIMLLRYHIHQFQPDEIVISSFAVVKNIVHPTKRFIWSPTISVYIHSPLMYIHNHYDHNFSKLHFPKNQLYRFAKWCLYDRDLLPRHYDHIRYNSIYTQTLCQSLYGWKKWDIRHPFIASFPTLIPSDSPLSPYVIFLGRLVRFSKQLELIIWLCESMKQYLVIVGSWPDAAYLKTLAGPYTTFRWYQTGHDKYQLLADAQWLINLTIESFGIVTVESLAMGTPVLGYREGATQEWVDEGSGIIVDDLELSTLQWALERLVTQSRDRKSIQSKGRKRVEAIQGQRKH